MAFKITYITVAARKALERNHDDVLGWVADRGIYGELFHVNPGADADSKINARRFVSAYKLKDHTILWIMTGLERSITVISMPYEISGVSGGGR